MLKLLNSVYDVVWYRVADLGKLLPCSSVPCFSDLEEESSLLALMETFLQQFLATRLRGISFILTQHAEVATVQCVIGLRIQVSQRQETPVCAGTHCLEQSLRIADIAEIIAHCHKLLLRQQTISTLVDGHPSQQHVAVLLCQPFDQLRHSFVCLRVKVVERDVVPGVSLGELFPESLHIAVEAQLLQGLAEFIVRDFPIALGIKHSSPSTSQRTTPVQ
mmetsp:Transcript_952/g.2646  ORF Transcript_952/g.2646 Transcript_952/m.2646 type:complete len:219 (+) Transcript_952:1220-1876(+)